MILYYDIDDQKAAKRVTITKSNIDDISKFALNHVHICLVSQQLGYGDKYECDIIQATSVLIILQNLENDLKEAISLVTPIPKGYLISNISLT